MPRIRTIKPEFWEDDVVGSLSLGARLLFIATWNLADDEGLLRWTPAYLKASVFMYDDDVQLADVASWMEELTASKLLFPYKGGRTQQRLAYIVKFRRHQRINRPQPGKLPPPSVQNREVRLMYAYRDRFTCQICNRPITETHGDKGPSLDHRTPRAKGGSDYPSNIQATHLSCNKGRRDTDLAHSVSDSLNDSLNDAFTDSLSDSLLEGSREMEGDQGDGGGSEQGVRAVVVPGEISHRREEGPDDDNGDGGGGGGKAAAVEQMRSDLDATLQEVDDEGARRRLGGKATLIAAGDAPGSWRDPRGDGVEVPWPERPPLFRMALAQVVAEERLDANAINRAMRYVLATQLDPYPARGSSDDGGGGPPPGGTFTEDGYDVEKLQAELR